MKLPTPEELFKQFDTNGDGSLSKEEFAAGLQKMREKFHEIMRSRFGGQEGQHFGPPGMHPPFGPRGMTFPTPAELIAKFDKNKDGKLTKDEVPPWLWEHISKADTKGDGAITKEELEAAHKKMQEHFQQRMKEYAGSCGASQANTPAKKSETTPKKTGAPPKSSETAPKK